MNILIVTTLYPRDKRNEERYTKAIHNWATVWARNNVVHVVRPEINFNGFVLKKEKYLIDNVTVHLRPVLMVPKTGILVSRVDKIAVDLETHGFSPDVVVCHELKAVPIGYRLSKTLKKPLVMGVHAYEYNALFTYRYRNMLEKAYDYAQLIACRSPILRDRFIEACPHLRDRVFVGYSGVGKEWAVSMKRIEQKLDEWKSSSNVIKIITVSRLIGRKKIEIVLSALAEMKEFNWQYNVVGDGPLIGDLEQCVKELGLSDRVTFLGHLGKEKLKVELKKSHVSVLISENETFGLVYLEALAAGNLVIGKAGDGIDGILQNGWNGYMVQGNKLSLKKTLEKVFRMEKGELKKVVVNGWHTALSHNEDNAAENYLNKLKGL